MKKLFLDDFRMPPDSTWDVVRSYRSFVDYIKENGVPDVISFDHDLGQEHYDVYDKTPKLGNVQFKEVEEHYSKFFEKTGYDCAKWLVENELMPEEYTVHSMNPVGKQNIEFMMAIGYKKKRNNKKKLIQVLVKMGGK